VVFYYQFRVKIGPWKGWLSDLAESVGIQNGVASKFLESGGLCRERPTNGEGDMDRKLLVTICMVVSVVILGDQPAFSQGGGDSTKGKAFWQGFNCKMCHGPNGEGKYGGPRAGDGKKAEDWIKQVRTPIENMPNYSAAQVNDADLADMWAYMQTLPKPASFTPLAYTPAPGDSPGKVLYYQKLCGACHGDVIKSIRAPVKMPHYSIKQVTDEQAGRMTEFLAK
jgi:cytochrome c551/c552